MLLTEGLIVTCFCTGFFAFLVATLARTSLQLAYIGQVHRLILSRPMYHEMTW